ncbi:hypothetical protein OC846_004081 [Tilletia horrida]|uniref:Protein kinase domain-containing protein n=1 Tax=Tilletia horrida TaxID=155126 RepID=A0AAN6GRB3_9BASI|nr:hypothetical protein OC846_004081 [Tilletia horrida]KAK0564569.1 hypothetical protein OC861_004216 [Tilletia horrida]
MPSQHTHTPSATPGRQRRYGALQQDHNGTPTPSSFPTRSEAVGPAVATAPTSSPSSALSQIRLHNQPAIKHHHMPAGQVPLPEPNIKRMVTEKDARGQPIRQAPCVAVAPPTLGNPEHSVSMDLSAEVAAVQQPHARQETPVSSSETYATTYTAGHHSVAEQPSRALASAPTGVKHLLSPAHVPERRAEAVRTHGAAHQAGPEQSQPSPRENQRKDAERRQHHAHSEPLTAPALVAAPQHAPQQRQNEGIYSLTDEQLADRLHFGEEIGHGNWGSIWTVYARHPVSLTPHLPEGTLAAKLCHRQRTAPSNARVRSLWNEFKVLKAVGSAPWPKDRNPRKASLGVEHGGRAMAQAPSGHPAIMRFYEFLVSPSYAVIVMPYYPQPMNVSLPPETCRAYFQHLLSGVFWLHQNNVTHNDVKTANTMIEILPMPPGTPPDTPLNPVLHTIPILADFGFAQLHDEAGAAKNVDRDGNLMPRFCTKNSWGTPEYLSPERARGELHDERLSDLWSLGVTFFEIATGRTPFEKEDEQFLTKDELAIYYERTLSGRWIGPWNFSDELEDLIRGMLHPDASKRISETDALLHPYFAESALIQDADDFDISDMTDDLDASLGAMVRSQVEAARAEKELRSAQRVPSFHPSVLDEPSTDIDTSTDALSSNRHRSYGDESLDHNTVSQTNATGLVASDGKSHVQSHVAFPSAETQEHQHHTEQHRKGLQSQQQQIAPPTSTPKKAVNYPEIVSSPVPPLNHQKKSPNEPRAGGEGLLSPVISKYKKSQALISGALYGTPKSKPKSPTTHAAVPEPGSPNRLQATPMGPVPKSPRAQATPRSAFRSLLRQADVSTEAAARVDGLTKIGNNSTRSSVNQSSNSHKRIPKELGSPILLQHATDAVKEGESSDSYNTHARSISSTLTGRDDRSYTDNDKDSASSTRSNVNKDRRFMSLARTVKRSISKTSIRDGSKIAKGNDRTADSSSRHFFAHRRTQTASRIEQSSLLSQTNPDKRGHAPSRSEVHGASSRLPIATGRQNPLVQQRRIIRAASEVFAETPSKKAAPVPGSDEVTEEEAEVTQDMASPTLATQKAIARAKAAAVLDGTMPDVVTTAPSSVPAKTASTMRTQERRRTYSDCPSVPPLPTKFDAIAGRLDAMSHHASSLLRLVEETRSTMAEVSSSEDLSRMPAASHTDDKRSVSDRTPLLQEDKDEGLERLSKSLHNQSSIPSHWRQTSGQRGKIGPPRSLKTQTSTITTSHVSEGNTTHVGEHSEGTTLVGDEVLRSPDGADSSSFPMVKASSATRSGERLHTPAYATIRKHNSQFGWHGTQLRSAQSPATPSMVGSETFHTAMTPGSPASSHWIKVDSDAVEKDGHNAEPKRFSMRRTRSFVLSALTNQSHPEETGKALQGGRREPTRVPTTHVSSAATAAPADADGLARGSVSMASPAVSYRPLPDASVTQALESPRTPGKTVSRLLKLIRGGGGALA